MTCQFPVRPQLLPLQGGTVSTEAHRVMGDLQHFCLRWNNYQNSITTAFENLRDDEDFIDVTLACDGKSLKAHRVVLSACSPYFRELLKSTPCKHPVIVLQDVVFDDLQALVEFIYHGEVNVHQRNLSSFLKTAEVLRVSGLTQPSDSTTANDHSARQSSETPPAENSFLQSFAAQASEGRVSPHVRQRKGIPQQSPSSIPSPPSKENSPIPLKRNKTSSNPSSGGGGGMDLSERTSQHSPSSAGSRPNCNDDDDAGERSDGGGGPVVGSNGHSNGHQSHNHHLHQHNQHHDEPPMDYSRTHQQHQQQQPAANALQHLQDTAQNLMISRRSPAEVKTEPMDTATATAVNSNSAYADDSNDSAPDFTGVNPAIGMSEPDDTSYQSHHSYLDSKFFAAAGASFNFSMAAAMAADSLAGLNNHNHTNVMEALGGSSSQDWSEAGGGGVSGGGAETLSCFVCGKRLSTRLTLKRHIEQQHNQPLHSAVCNVCNKVFRTLNSLNNHKSIYHRKPKAYKSASGGGNAGAAAAAAASTVATTAPTTTTTTSAAAVTSSSASPDGNGGASGCTNTAAADAAASSVKNLPPLTMWYNNNINNNNNNNNNN
ncbi:broad-complex core protein isoforms 1/2/3/4/5-like isoform X2 [Rhopalosiphum maidis]|uniref:broad-complex core protein isoforms 1/2/3/4/5-like isoform X2 n=1 Tax=Rhopalosiphum maidis TaxID=43146 RepID=UPI000EFE64B5|nr:broad-complex core protein isoforms 1/2/3/4/5-like isoform X2 [Rhopalosiphum maidis]